MPTSQSQAKTAGGAAAPAEAQAGEAPAEGAAPEAGGRRGEGRRAATEQPAGAGGVRGFLAEVAAQEIPADTTREAEVRGRGVRLLTAHRAKGLEWAVVVVAGVQEGLWPAPGQGGAILDPAELLSDGLVGRPDSRESLADARKIAEAFADEHMAGIAADLERIATGEDTGEAR